ncbi:MAG TPA: four helix bundle protein, partial [Candidatus Krumholzibacteria bacterium]
MADSERYSFKNLEVWKAAQQFAVDVSRLVDDLPNTRSADVIGRQLLRSATSVGANIAEGHARYTFGAYRNHLSIAKGSAAESEHWVDL